MAHAKKGTSPFHIVGIGASAGGLEALDQFFDRMPDDSGLAFVVIQHLSPDFKSQMDELLSHHTRMPIRLIEEGVRLEPDHVYLTKPLSEVSLKDGRFTLGGDGDGAHPHLLIDTFFASLAREAGGHAIGVILSGTGRDGSAGLRAIHEAGGLAVAQSPESAGFDGMPQSAVDTGICDYILPPAEIPPLLATYLEHPAGPLFLGRSGPGSPAAGDEGGFSQIYGLLMKYHQLDLSRYKLTTVGRRIKRRMGFCQTATVEHYAAVLAGNRDELDALYRDLLIGVTEFFRDRKSFRYLEDKVIPGLFADRSPDRELRVWSAGCATGEEAYSLAILLLEKADELHFTGTITVFATDVHKQSLGLASQGVYERGRLAQVSPEQLKRYFVPVGHDQYKVSTDLRKILVFALHNLISDPPFPRLDLVCCRNLLIYLRTDTRKRVLSLFHFSLNLGGILFLGSSEGLSELSGEFEPVSGEHKVFKKLRELKRPVEFRSSRTVNDRTIPAPGVRSVQPMLVTLERQVLHDYDELLARHIPPGVLIDRQGKILHYFGNVADYLRTPKGRVESDRLLLSDNNLQVALSTSLQRAVKTGQSVVTRDIRMQRGEEESLIDLTVDPIPDGKSETVHYHVYFQRVRPVERRAPLPDCPDVEVGSFDADLYTHQHISDLETELQSTRENLQVTRENLQASSEEQQATIEEFQVTNEELQATNEELRATNEELHSANEELYSVNSELERKNVEFNRLAVEHDNMLSSIDAGMIFLDRELCIHRFNPAIASFFTLLPQDIGRSLNDIAFHLADRARVQADIRQVLATGDSIGQEVEAPDGSWLLIRIMPFKGVAGEVEGVVITFTDISPMKKAEQAVLTLNERLHEANEKLAKMNEALELRVAGRTRELEKIRSELVVQNEELHKSHRLLETEGVERTLAVEELRKKEQLLIQQSRLAAMGEMLANIAHQWRQPMNILGLKIQEIGLSYELGGFSKELLDTNIEKALDILFHLSRTIDDFRDFSAPDKEKCTFSLGQTVDKTVSLIKDNFHEQGITIAVEVSGEPQVNGYANEYRQTLLNIFMNAKDAFLERKTCAALITVAAWSDRKRAVLTITDNAGGIDEEIIEKVFDPYFTTKDLGKGTGIGLFMSKTIVEKNMGGRLTVSNVPGGVQFRIEV